MAKARIVTNQNGGKYLEVSEYPGSKPGETQRTPMLGILRIHREIVEEIADERGVKTGRIERALKKGRTVEF